MLQAGVFASRFPTAESTLWTIVNRNEHASTGEQIRTPHRAGMHYYDLWRGTELTPAIHGNEATLGFSVEGLGFGAVLATERFPAAGPGADPLKNLLSYMAERSRRRLSSYSREWNPLAQKMVEIPATECASGNGSYSGRRLRLSRAWDRDTGRK